MEEGKPIQHIAKQILTIDQLCYEKCVKNFERAHNVKEEACLKNCITKVINGLDFLHNINLKGGFDRAPFKTESGFWSSQ